MPQDAETTVVIAGTRNREPGQGLVNMEMTLTSDEVARLAAAGDESETGTLHSALKPLTTGDAPRAAEWQRFLDSTGGNNTSAVNLSFRAPAKAFAVWSPGGDGVDDGGLETQHYIPKLRRIVGDNVMFVPE